MGILSKQAALLYQASHLDEKHLKSYNLKFEALLLAFQGKKGTEENRRKLPENLSTHAYHRKALKEIHKHLMNFGFAKRIAAPKPGHSTNLSARQFVSFFKNDDRAADSNSMRPRFPETRCVHEI